MQPKLLGPPSGRLPPPNQSSPSLRGLQQLNVIRTQGDAPLLLARLLHPPLIVMAQSHDVQEVWEWSDEDFANLPPQHITCTVSKITQCMKCRFWYLFIFEDMYVFLVFIDILRVLRWCQALLQGLMLPCWGGWGHHSQWIRDTYFRQDRKARSQEKGLDCTINSH